MFMQRLIVWLTFAGVCAAFGNYSYFCMEGKLRKSGLHQPRLLKYPTDFWAVFAQYRAMALAGNAPAWPSKMFLASLIGFVLSILYVLLVPNPFKPEF